MTPLEKLNEIEARMEECMTHNRFDTFNQLAADRMLLLKRASRSPDKGDLFPLAHQQTERWVERLRERIEQMQRQRTRSKSLAGYGTARNSGKLLNRSF